MRRLGCALIVLTVLATACGGDSPEAADDGAGIAALDREGAEADRESGDKGNGKDKEVTRKPSKTKAGGTSSSSNSAPTSAPPSGDTGATETGGPQPATPVPSGTHSYDTDGQTTVSGNTRDMPKTTTLTARGPSGGRQVQVRDLRDQEGNGTVVETGLLYQKDGVYITYVKITATFPGGLTDVRELRPRRPALAAPTGARPGASGSFVMEGSGTRAAVTIKALRFEEIAVGGANVNTLVVGTRIVFSGAVEGEQTSTSWFWGKHVMALREQVSTDVTNGPIRFQSNYEAALTKLP